MVSYTVECPVCRDIMCPHNECDNPDCPDRTVGCEMCDLSEINKQRERAGLGRLKRSVTSTSSTSVGKQPTW